MRLDFLERIHFLESASRRLTLIVDHSKKREEEDEPDFHFTAEEMRQLEATHDLLNREEQRQRRERNKERDYE